MCNPTQLDQAIPQVGRSFYYPQRKPEDGYADWNLNANDIYAHCRSLTRPYPGLRSLFGDRKEVIIWKCQPFDDLVDKTQGSINLVFEDGSFLVQDADGRLLVMDYDFVGLNTSVTTQDILKSIPFADTIERIVDRHSDKYPDLQIARRIRSYKKKKTAQ